MCAWKLLLPKKTTCVCKLHFLYQQNFQIMQWCNIYTHSHTHSATRIFNWTVSRFHFRNITHTYTFSHSLLLLLLSLFGSTYKYNFNLRLPCWSPIYFDNMIFVSRINAHTLGMYVCMSVCSAIHTNQPTDQPTKSPFNNNNNEFFWLNKSISKYYAFDAWIHIHLLRVFRVNLVQNRSQTISHGVRNNIRTAAWHTPTHAHTNKRTDTHSTQRNFAHFSVSFCCLYAWKLGTRTHSRTRAHNIAIAIAN